LVAVLLQALSAATAASAANPVAIVRCLFTVRPFVGLGNPLASSLPCREVIVKMPPLVVG
jgi:hypothetical protein